MIPLENMIQLYPNIMTHLIWCFIYKYYLWMYTDKYTVLEY